MTYAELAALAGSCSLALLKRLRGKGKLGFALIMWTDTEGPVISIHGPIGPAKEFMRLSADQIEAHKVNMVNLEQREHS